MATLRNTTIGNATGHLRLPIGTGNQRPTQDAQSVGSIRINSDNGKLEYWNGTAWELNSVAFPFRTIITTAFLQGGYKDAVTWNNVNKTFTSTDTTVNLGDNSIERSHNYAWGACSKDYAYTFGAGNAHATASNYTIAYNMRTEQQATDISRTLTASRNFYGGLFQEHFTTWFAGGSISGAGSENIEEYNLVTKTAIGNVGGSIYTTSTATWGMSTENYGLFYTANSAITFTFATRTQSSRGDTSPSNSDQQKSVNSKWNFAYAGNQGTFLGGNNFRRTNWTTNTTTVPGLNKPVQNSGEENLTLGQDHQYMLGMYNGLQNNISWRWNYSTESGFQGGASMEPKGKEGASSGICSWID